MTDLRALLLEPWCPQCIAFYESVKGHEPPDRPLCIGDDHDAVRRLPIATRLPECVPPGLEWEEGWMIIGADDCADITDAQAELLFIGQAILLIAQSGWVLDYSTDGWNVFGWGTDAEESQCGGPQKDAISALAAALHQWIDEWAHR